MLDLIIINGQYPDFNQGTFIEGNVEIKDGKISYLDQNSFKSPLPGAKKIYDGKGLIISPGFIDIHMHEEDFVNEREKFLIGNMMLFQGVTTCLAGQCGVQHQKIKLFKEVIEELGGAPINYLLFAGYNQARSEIGIGRYEHPTGQQEKEIINKIQSEIAEGASGISFGIEYDPGITFDEICRVIDSIADETIIVAAHYRADGKSAIEAIKEMIRIQEHTQKNFKFLI